MVDIKHMFYHYHLHFHGASTMAVVAVALAVAAEEGACIKWHYEVKVDQTLLISGNSWMYPNQHTDMGNPYISPI